MTNTNDKTSILLRWTRKSMIKAQVSCIPKRTQNSLKFCQFLYEMMQDFDHDFAFPSNKHVALLFGQAGAGVGSGGLPPLQGPGFWGRAALQHFVHHAARVLQSADEVRVATVLKNK